MPKKPLTAYIESPPEWWSDALTLYALSPATAFLTEAVHLSDAMNQCARHFPHKKIEKVEYTKDSQDSIHRIAAAILAAMMSHFETYQRFLFAGVLEATRFIPDFDINDCCRRLQKDLGVTIDLARLSAYRGQPAPIGQVVADSLPGWHDPDKVNAYFRPIAREVQLYSKDDMEALSLFWQLRHSVVHTAGWLTQPDAQNLPVLAQYGQQPLIFGKAFVGAVARRLHTVVASATTRLGDKFRDRLPDNLAQEDQTQVEALFRVHSPRQSWLSTEELDKEGE